MATWFAVSALISTHLEAIRARLARRFEANWRGGVRRWAGGRGAWRVRRGCPEGVPSAPSGSDMLRSFGWSSSGDAASRLFLACAQRAVL